MAEFSVPEFIKKLDSCFSREDLKGAGECLDEAMKNARAAGDKNGELTVFNEMIGYYRQTKEAEKGLEAVEAAFGLIDRLGINRELSAGTIYLNGATTMKAFGKSGEAIQFYHRASDIFKMRLERSHPLVAGLFNNLALALQDLKEYEEAEDCFRQAIEITESLKGSELETAVSYVNLAMLLHEMNSEDERINPLMDKALAILRNPAYYGYDKYAFTCRKCASGFGYLGFFFAEKELNERADKAYARA